MVASAYDFAVKNADGVTIYYNYIKDGNELAVTYINKDGSNKNAYSGTINIPENVTYMNRTRTVTLIGDFAFSWCHNVTSVSMPNTITAIGSYAFYECNNMSTIHMSNNITSIGERAFWYCTKLESITIPNGVTELCDESFRLCSGLQTITIPQSVTFIGKGAFVGCDLVTVISKIESPFSIPGDNYTIFDERPFNSNTYYNATLYVPLGTIEEYKKTSGWKEFCYIEEGEGGSGNPSSQKCEKPTISYQNRKLTFHSNTEGATCHYIITDSDIKSGSSNEVDLNVTYYISVYATKSDFENSETATATLCWIDVDPKTEGLTDGIANVPAQAVLIQSNGGQLNIQGINDGTTVNVYSINGTQAGSAISSNGSAMVNTNLQPGSIAIVKIGEKSVKVVVK